MPDPVKDPVNPAILARIVATIGPASEAPETVRKLIDAGVTVFRFNFSHGELSDHERRLGVVRKVAQDAGRAVACLGDLQGPKIRIGKVPDGGISLSAGQDVIFRAGHAVASIENGVVVLPTVYERLVDEVEPGQKVLINDGLIRMLAMERDTAKRELRCRVHVGGLVTTGKGINLPQSDLSAPAITERDWACVAWAIEHGIDFLALSFVRRAREVQELKEHLWQKRKPAGVIPVIAKIEKPQALTNLAGIVDAADAIIVARGDLGVEMEIARVPVAQKEIIAACNDRGKPCIVATQMLETMIENSMPTRAEASDVANAVFDQADAVMLSAETATGKHPALVVETMARIVAAAEARVAALPPVPTPPRLVAERHGTVAALAHAAWHMARDLSAKAIVCWSEQGGTARYLSQNNFKVPILAYSSSAEAARRMALFGGVRAVHSAPPASGLFRDWTKAVEEDLISHGVAKAGDVVILIAGKPLGMAKNNNSLWVHRVGQDDPTRDQG